MFSFDYNLYTLEDLGPELSTLNEGKGLEYDNTYYLHILNSDFYLVSDVIVFELSKSDLNKSVEYLYNKIKDKILNSEFNTSGVFYIHIGKQLLNALDFKILRLNSPNIGK